MRRLVRVLSAAILLAALWRAPMRGHGPPAVPPRQGPGLLLPVGLGVAFLVTGLLLGLALLDQSDAPTPRVDGIAALGPASDDHAAGLVVAMATRLDRCRSRADVTVVVAGTREYWRGMAAWPPSCPSPPGGAQRTYWPRASSPCSAAASTPGSPVPCRKPRVERRA